MLAVLADWRERLQDEVDAATALLQIAPIATAIEDGDVDAQALFDPRSISIGRDFVQRIGKVVGLVYVYREIGQIYVTDKQLVFAPCDREMARDLVAGWLCGMRDISIGADETFASTYGATILQVANNAPLHLRVAVVLGLDTSPSASPEMGGDRASNILAGWLAARSGQPCPVMTAPKQRT